MRHIRQEDVESVLQRRIVGLGTDGSINSYTAVGANSRTGCTAYACFLIVWKGKMVATIIDLLWLEKKNVLRACHDTKVAALAAFSVNFDSSYYSGHFQEIYVDAIYRIPSKGAGVVRLVVQR